MIAEGHERYIDLNGDRSKPPEHMLASQELHYNVNRALNFTVVR